MAQPIWITPAGTLGEFVSYPSTAVNVQLVAAVSAPGTTLTYKVLSGSLPSGFSINATSGVISGNTSFTSIDVINNFTIRASDDKGYIRDRTFSIKVLAATVPQFTTPAGLIISTPDSEWISYQIAYTTPSTPVTITVSSGSLPPGLEMTTDGLIQGYPTYPGYGVKYQFTLKITGETGSSTRDYAIDVTQSTNRLPTILNTRPVELIPTDADINYGYYILPPVSPSIEADIGNFIYDDYFAFKLIGYDFNSLGLTYQFVPAITPLPSGLIPLPNGPSGLTLDPVSGWITGHPTQPSASVTGSILATTLTVTAVGSGTLYIGETIVGTGITTGTKVLRQLSASNTPSATPTATGTVATNTLTVSSSTGISVGQFVSGAGIISDTYVTAINGTTVTINNLLTLAPLGTYNFYVAGKEGTYEVSIDQTVAATTITAPIDVQTYVFAAQVTNTSGAVSPVFNFKFTMSDGAGASITWKTGSNLGTINNSDISMLSIKASSDYPISYRIISGSLPPNLSLRDDGLIIGKVAYQPTNTVLTVGQKTVFTFTVQAYSNSYPSILSSDRTFTLTVVQEYPEIVESVYMEANPDFEDRAILDSFYNLGSGIIATVTSSDSTTNLFTCDTTAGISPGSLVTFTGSGAAFGGVSFGTQYYVSQVTDSRNFSISLVDGGAVLNLSSESGTMSLNTIAMPDSFIYRLGDPYFGKASEVIYNHAYGVYASDVDTYLEAIRLNHYRKNITLGELKTAVAKNEAGEVIYEVVYSSIIDDLVNNYGVSISKEMIWPHEIILPEQKLYFTALGDVYTSYAFIVNGYPTYYTSLAYSSVRNVYPNSLINMRKQLYSVITQSLDDRFLPLWMTSQQSNGSTLGFTPAWVICYTQPGKSEIIKTNIEKLWNYKFNIINFEVDKITVNKSATYNYINTASIPYWQELPSATSKSKTINAIFPPNIVTSPDNLENWYVNMPIQLYGTPLVTYLSQVTSTAAGTNWITCSNTASLSVGMQIMFTGTVFGNIIANTVYYVRQIINLNQFTISLSNGGPEVILSTAIPAAGTIMNVTAVSSLLNNVTYYVKSIDLSTNSFTLSKRIDAATETFTVAATGTMIGVPMYGELAPLDSKDYHVFFQQKTILPGVE